MLFEKVDVEDVLGPLCLVWTFPVVLRTGHGENAARKSNAFRRLRHVPKYADRSTLKQVGYLHGSVRTESRHNFVERADFVPEFMQYTSCVERVVVVPTAVIQRSSKVAAIDRKPRSATLFERFLAKRNGR